MAANGVHLSGKRLFGKKIQNRNMELRAFFLVTIDLSLKDKILREVLYHFDKLKSK